MSSLKKNRLREAENFQEKPFYIKEPTYYKDLEYFNPKRLIQKNLFHTNIHRVTPVSQRGKQRPANKKLVFKKRALCNKNNGIKKMIGFLIKEVFDGLKSFLCEGSLHGLKYIMEPKNTLYERITWCLIMVISFTSCSYNCHQLILKSQNSPFVNVLDSLATPIWAVPFPLVVICPDLHVKMSYVNVSALDGIEKSYASLLCPEMSEKTKRIAKRFTPDQLRLFQEFIVSSGPKCTDIIASCYWKGIGKEWINNSKCCELLFLPVFTNYGLCYAFNHLSLNGMTNETISWQKTFTPQISQKNITWTPDGGYPRVYTLDPQLLPLRATGSGTVNGLGVELTSNLSEYQYDCDGDAVGFNILIGSQTDSIYVNTATRLTLGRLTTLEVSPVIHKTDPELRKVEAIRRQCLFQDEKKLEYFSIYSDTNSVQDFLIHETKRMCDCVLYNWPRKSIDEPICTTAVDMECANFVNDNVEQQIMSSFYPEADKVNNKKWKSADENPHYFFPSCNDIFYHRNVFHSSLAKVLGPNWNASAVEGTEVTRIDVHFHEDMFIGLRRHAQFDELYFVGAIGGLLSLFLGFSIITVAEFFWFTILRPSRRALCVLLGSKN